MFAAGPDWPAGRPVSTT